MWKTILLFVVEKVIKLGWEVYKDWRETQRLKKEISKKNAAKLKEIMNEQDRKTRIARMRDFLNS